MKVKLIAILFIISVVQLSFDLPKNQQPQMFGSPYYAELVVNHSIKTDAKIGFLPTRYANFDEVFMLSNSSVGTLLQKIDSTLESTSAQKINLEIAVKSNDLPEVYFGPMNETMEQPLYVQRNIEGYAPNQVVMAAYKGKKKVNTYIIELMNKHQLDYILVPCLRETFVYPSGILKEKGLLSSTSASAKNYYIDLGTNHVIKGEKIQALNQPVGVFVLCMGLMNKQGKMVSMVSEGLGMLKQSNIAEQILSIRTLSAPQDINKFLNKKRDDLSNAPYCWEEATHNAYLHLMQRNGFVPKVKFQMGN